jgi:RimJ/RimL family protein N-acetyltransferase
MARLSDEDLDLRPLRLDDVPLIVRWLAEPHVAAWWRDRMDLAAAVAHYQPRIDGTDPTRVRIISVLGRPAGWIQWYRWADYARHAAELDLEPGAAGLDLAIGELDLVGLGFGPRAIELLLQREVWSCPDVTACVVDPELANTRSVRMFARAGFEAVRSVVLEGETAPRQVMRRGR